MNLPTRVDFIVIAKKTILTMSKSTNFTGQPIFGTGISLSLSILLRDCLNFIPAYRTDRLWLVFAP